LLRGDLDRGAAAKGILNPRYVIHTFASDAEFIAMSRTSLSYVSESEW
jgi:hypothetical protein